MNLIGDVKGKVAVMVDDMIDTAGMALISVLMVIFSYPELDIFLLVLNI